MPRVPSKRKEVFEHPNGQLILNAELNGRNELVRRRKPTGFRLMEVTHAEFVDTFAFNSRLDSRTAIRVACKLMFNEVYTLALTFFCLILGLSDYAFIVCLLPPFKYRFHLLPQLKDAWDSEKRTDAAKIEAEDVVWLKTRITKTILPQSQQKKYELLCARRQQDREKLEDAQDRILVTEVMGTKRVGNLAEAKHKRKVSKTNTTRKNGIRQTPWHPQPKTIKEVYLETWKPSPTWIPHHTAFQSFSTRTKTTRMDDKNIPTAKRLTIKGTAKNRPTLHRFLDKITDSAVDYFGDVR